VQLFFSAREVVPNSFFGFLPTQSELFKHPFLPLSNGEVIFVAPFFLLFASKERTQSRVPPPPTLPSAREGAMFTFFSFMALPPLPDGIESALVKRTDP